MSLDDVVNPDYQFKWVVQVNPIRTPVLVQVTYSCRVWVKCESDMSWVSGTPNHNSSIENVRAFHSSGNHGLSRTTV